MSNDQQPAPFTRAALRELIDRCAFNFVAAFVMPFAPKNQPIAKSISDLAQALKHRPVAMQKLMISIRAAVRTTVDKRDAVLQTRLTRDEFNQLLIDAIQRNLEGTHV